MRISVCIATYNREVSLARILGSIREAHFDTSQIEVLVIDNNSTDSTRDVAESARSWFSNFQYVVEKKQGLSYARNTGSRISCGEIICYLDDDTIIAPNYFCAVDDIFTRFGCAGVGARIVPDWECPKPKSFAIEGPYNVARGVLVCFDKGDDDQELKSPWFGAGMSIRRSALEKHGLFAEDLSRVGRNAGMGEDSEMFLRLRAEGEKIFYAPKAIVYHSVDPSRLNMTFLRKWHFECGKSDAMMDMSSYRTFSGIPLWTLRKSLVYARQWFTASGSPKRAFVEAKLWETFGLMYGYRRRGQRKQEPPHFKANDGESLI